MVGAPSDLQAVDRCVRESGMAPFAAAGRRQGPMKLNARQEIIETREVSIAVGKGI